MSGHVKSVTCVGWDVHEVWTSRELTGGEGPPNVGRSSPESSSTTFYDTPVPRVSYTAVYDTPVPRMSIPEGGRYSILSTAHQVAMSSTVGVDDALVSVVDPLRRRLGTIPPLLLTKGPLSHSCVSPGHSGFQKNPLLQLSPVH